MTTIAFDGHTLATDSQETRGSTKFLHADKLIRIPGGFIASAGRADDGEMFIEWMAEGAPQDAKPQLSEEAINRDGFVGVFLGEDGIVYEYFGSLVPLKVHGKMAWGSGDEIAIAAMELGLTAREAIKLAVKKDVYTGGKVRHVTFEKKKKSKGRK